MNSSLLIAFSASLPTLSFNSFSERSFGTTTSPAFGFGSTVTGTLTFSLNLPFPYVTGTSTSTSLSPAFPTVDGTFVGSPTVPPSPGVIPFLISSEFGVSPSNTTTDGGVEDTTFTGTSITLVILFPSLSLYSTVTVAGVCLPTVSVPGVVLTSVTVTVTPSGRPSSFLAASSAFSLTTFANSVLSASFGTVTPSGLTFGNTVTGTVTSSSPPSL